MRALLYAAIAFVAYLAGFCSGFNRGFDLAQCLNLPFNEQVACYKRVNE